ncbi:hypothetical protein [Actinomycetospora termitidis]|uniref:Uncharacterized protein n=1 Tax=Actinomycetospora termitidis TaxID=3053470 RepID=A0ABT7MGN6_9PSEU|nr:hypothetical protein [Actinomycetospora sp. Odt1-22]MDL5159815.1 hypothetical protein [Actinomycetospora sp. Odt1-22]
MTIVAVVCVVALAVVAIGVMVALRKAFPNAHWYGASSGSDGGPGGDGGCGGDGGGGGTC